MPECKICGIQDPLWSDRFCSIGCAYTDMVNKNIYLEQQNAQLRTDLAQRDAEGEALRKAVEWMKQIAEFFAYKAPEQINAVKLIAAMGDTAKDALAKVKGHKNEWGEW